MRFRGVLPPVTTVDASRGARLRRWARRTALGLAVFAASFVLGMTLLAGNLERPWLKGCVQKLAHDSGVDVDYGTVRLAWLSGLTIEGLVVQSPPEFRAVAPELVRVGHLDARWSFASLSGAGPRVEALTISDVALTVVIDENGRTSFDALSPASAPPATTPPAVPLSHQASEQLRAPPPVAALDVRGVSAAVVRTDRGRVIERDAVRGVGLAMTSEPAPGGWRVRVQAGSPARPLELALDRAIGEAPSGTARTQLWLSLEANAAGASVRANVKVLEQTFAPGFPAGDWLHLEGDAHFDPAAGRTTLEVQRTSGAGGAVTTEATIEVPDQGDPVVHHAQGAIDAAALLTWAPPGLVPVTARQAHLAYQVDAFVVGSTPHFGDGGSATVDVDLGEAHLDLAGGPLDVTGAKATVRAGPDSQGGIVARASIAAATLQLVTGRDRIAARGVTIAVDAEGLHLASGAPQATRGDVTLSAGAASLDARAGGERTIADGLGLTAHAHLDGHAPYAAEVGLPVARLRVLGADGHQVLDAATRVDVALRDAEPDLDHPAASRGSVHATLAYADDHVALDATKGADAVDYTLAASGPTFNALRPLLPASLAEAAPWGAMAFALHSTGHADRMASSRPSLRESTELTIERPAYANLSARTVAIKLHSDGDAYRHTVGADIAAAGLVVGGQPASDDDLTLSASFDRARPSLALQVDTKGRMTARLSASVSFDRARRAVMYDVSGRLAELAPIAPLLAGVHGLEGLDVSKLAVTAASRGAVLGVVSSVAGDGSFALAPNPRRTVAVDGKLDVGVAGFRWSAGGTSVAAPDVEIHADLSAADGRRTFAGHVDVATVDVGVGPHVIHVVGVTDEGTAVVTGDLVDPGAQVTQRATVRTVEQDYAPDYPVGDLSLALDVGRDSDGLVHLTQMKFENGAGGTTANLTGGVDLGPGRRRLSLTASVAQDLAPLSSSPERFEGRGQLAADAQIESPDLAVFRTRANLKVEGATVRMQRAGIDVESVEGSVPVTATFELGERGFQMHREAEPNPYSMLRFADQHPLLSRTGFLSIKSVKTPFFSIAPLVGNLEIEQNVVSLRQFEMGVRGGRITGQCGLDWDGAKSTVELHVRASGVQSSHGEPFDGNIAVVVSAADRTVEGRAEILRIGKRHLLDLLDLEDPLRTDPAMNRVRSALTFGYPKHLRLLFDHGFASAKLDLGGLASLISLDEMRGIPMGPIIDKAFGPVLDAKETQAGP
jgi:hypothetical protein